MKTNTTALRTTDHKFAHLVSIARPWLAIACLVLAWPNWADAVSLHAGRTPDLPSPVCNNIEVPAGYRLSFHAYALGVQIYRWNGEIWEFIAPEAGLFADPGFHGQIGIHYGGPTWEANDGSQVVAARVAGCTPFPSAIPWLLLNATSTSNRGMFASVAFIQRINTIGGTAPANPGGFLGEEARVPYSAEYYFYRSIQR